MYYPIIEESQILDYPLQCKSYTIHISNLYIKHLIHVHKEGWHRYCTAAECRSLFTHYWHTASAPVVASDLLLRCHTNVIAYFQTLITTNRAQSSLALQAVTVLPKQMLIRRLMNNKEREELPVETGFETSNKIKLAKDSPDCKKGNRICEISHPPWLVSVHCHLHTATSFLVCFEHLGLVPRRES